MKQVTLGVYLMSGFSDMFYQNINRIYSESRKVIVKKYTAFLGGLNKPWSDLNTIEANEKDKLRDSVLFADFKLPSKYGEENNVSPWKIHLSIHPQDIGKAWDIIFPVLIEKGVDEFKVTRTVVAQPLLQALKKVDDNYLAKHKLSTQDMHQAVEDIERVYHGMQVTIYIPEGLEKTYNEFLNKIESKLLKNGVRPGIVDKSDRMIGFYSSVRNVGKSYTAHDKVSGYKARTDIDPFKPVQIEGKSKKNHLIGMDYPRHTEKAKNTLQQVVDAKHKYDMAILDRGELDQVYDVAQEYFTFWEEALKDVSAEALKQDPVEQFKEFKKWIDHGYKYVPSVRQNTGRKAKEAEDLLVKKSRNHSVQTFVKPLLVRHNATRLLNRNFIKTDILSTADKQVTEQIEAATSARTLSELSLHRKKSFKKLSSKSFKVPVVSSEDSQNRQYLPVTVPLLEQIPQAPVEPERIQTTETKDTTYGHLIHSFVGAGIGVVLGGGLSVFFLPLVWIIALVVTVGLIGGIAGFGFSQLYVCDKSTNQKTVADNDVLKGSYFSIPSVESSPPSSSIPRDLSLSNNHSKLFGPANPQGKKEENKSLTASLS